MTHYPFPEKIFSLLEDANNCVLLETSRFDDDNYRSFLFLNPYKTVPIHKLEELPKLFHIIKKMTNKGYYAAGWFNYECGYFFEETPLNFDANNPVAWFGIYKQPLIFNHKTSTIESAPKQLLKRIKNKHAINLPSLNNLKAPKQLTISEQEYTSKIQSIKKEIESGRTYQVNFTDSIQFPWEHSSLALYLELQKNQPVSYGAFIKTEQQNILSFSPELFFRLDKENIIVKPMKGTAMLGKNNQETEKRKKALKNDPKNRAENLMIVDLLRNDLGRIAIPGSVTVPKLFSIEEYPSLLQMTSTITAKIDPRKSLYEIFRNIFPCGSITGAPKTSTMKIINQLEKHPRGIYTGSIGYFGPDQKAIFNVAIRTITIQDKQAKMGVGSGIVYDSDPSNEYKECLLKTNFLKIEPLQNDNSTENNDFDLLETMLWEKKFILLKKHLQRLEKSAQYFYYPFNKRMIKKKLLTSAKQFNRDKRYKIRLLLAKNGNLKIETSLLPKEATDRQQLVAIWPIPVNASEILLQHKTTHRPWFKHPYEIALQKGLDDVLFFNEHGYLTEGVISNIFIKQKDQLLTPPLVCGLLNGTFRQHLLETETNCVEKKITRQDLINAEAIYICNSVQGMRKVKLVDFDIEQTAQS